MGNSQAKESRPESRGQLRPTNSRNPSSPTASGPGESSHARPGSSLYASRTGRGSRPDLSFLGIGTGNAERDPALEPRRETKAEREARKLEKERALRVQERERSIREEGVDGGYLVTLGVYTGPEDFSKPVVRQLQIERKLAPFWKGLDDHSDTWVEHQLVAVVNGKPLPAPDEIPPEESFRPNNLSAEWNPRGSDTNVNSLTVPINARSMSQNSDRSANLSPSHPAFSLPSPTSPIAANSSSSSSPFFRGRAKTLAALTTGSRNNSQTEMTPQEMHLPRDPNVNGQRIEAFLYKNAEECPICFMYYPPYLNKTRCCDQPICSECFVQIKRPDPHPPEHHDDPNAPAPAEPQEDGQLVSEPAACPYCAQPEFGITYEPPPFRRGLVYANQGQHSLTNAASAMSSTSSLNSQGLTSPGRRRATSLAVNDSMVITTDRVRPDWSKKLADARAHALRRAAAATALHNAAYMMGNSQNEGRSFVLGRRRRTMFGNDSAGSSGNGTPRRTEEVNALLAAAAAQGSSSRENGPNDLVSGRQSSRRGNRLEDLEELMMMEAIRLSLAAEEDRKKKEEKEAAKEAKKEGKKKAKEAKKVAKAQKNIGSGFHPIDIDGDDGEPSGSSAAVAGKGKAVDRSAGATGLNLLSEPTSTLNESGSSFREDPQRHLEESRAQIQKEASGTGNVVPPTEYSNEPPSHRSALRNLSNASSSASSFDESIQGSLRPDGAGNPNASNSSIEPEPNQSGADASSRDETPAAQGTPGTEPMFNFRSLAEVITTEDGKDEGSQHIENVDDNKASASGAPKLPEPQPLEPLDESMLTVKPDNKTTETAAADSDDDEISPAPRVDVVSESGQLDQKHIGDVSMVDATTTQQATQ